MSKPKIYDYFVLVYQPQHPRAVNQGYVAEHYLVAEKEMGRPLTPDEEVRHKNGNTQDNRPSNLEVISYSKDYNARSLAENFGEKRVSAKIGMPCKFQRPCWKTIRAPIARENKVFLPYICSYQTEGDIYKCSRFWSFIDQEMKNEDVVEGEK
jgi:hypothetical protein